MKRITQILLRAYLRRNPVQFRLSQFNFLSRYSWLKNVLEDLRPELFPQQEEAEVAEVAGLPVEEAVPEALIHPLMGREIEGDRGIYTIEAFIRKRGNGLVFQGRQQETQQPVTIKVYRLEQPPFNESESRYRQQAFTSLAGLQLADEREHDFRVVCPIEAIADPHTFSTEDDIDDNTAESPKDFTQTGIKTIPNENGTDQKVLAYRHCYLITSAEDSYPTLKQAIAQQGVVSPIQVRQVLEQTLQALAFLHQQRYVFPSGQAQTGVVHGNLSLDSLLWVEYQDQVFTYLTDLALWEQCVVPPAPSNQTLPDSVVSPPAVAADLRQVGLVGLSLLNGQVITEVPDRESALWQRGDSELEQVIRRLLQQGAVFSSAEAAWQEVLALNLRGRRVMSSLSEAVVAQEDVPQQGRSPWLLSLLGVMLLAALGGFLWTLWMRPRTTASEPAVPAPCCLDEINAVPTGTFIYTAVEDGTWQYVEGQSNLLQRGQTLGMALRGAQPDVTLDFMPSESTTAAIAQVQGGAADFAIVPLTQPLGPDLTAQPIAYDGIVMLVPFSYAERNQGLPNALRGHIALADVRSLYSGRITRWKSLGGPNLPVQLYASLNPDVLDFFEQTVFRGRPLQALPGTDIKFFDDTLQMLQAIIQDFEFERPEGSIGFAALSEVVGQCSVYPLALEEDENAAVQPLVFTTGTPITPNTDLCDRKGAYHPDVRAFQSGNYPLAYPLAVVYPRDNRRATIGEKFVELMTTQEGQALLSEAGLVPLRPDPFARLP